MERESASLELRPTGDPNVFVAPDGSRRSPPLGWVRLPPGDAGLTRRVKAAGPSWTVIEIRKGKKFSHGVWAPATNIEAARTAIDAERSTDAYAKRKVADRARRERTQAAYVETFQDEVVRFLRFSREWAELGTTLARFVAAHATPVGSGTVARTQRIAVGERAEAAVIAWMRHQTTGYDDMQIARIKGERRAVRRELAQISRAVLDAHRRDVPHTIASCSLCAAVIRTAEAERRATRETGTPGAV